MTPSPFAVLPTAVTLKYYGQGIWYEIGPASVRYWRVCEEHQWADGPDAFSGLRACPGCEVDAGLQHSRGRDRYANLQSARLIR